MSAATQADWFAQNAPKQPQGGQDWFAQNAPKDTSSTAPTGFAARHPTLAKVGNFLGGALEGAEKGAEHTLGLYEPIPADRAKRSGFYRFTHPIIPGTADLAQPPQNTAEKVGYGSEQAAEFMAPGEAGASTLAEHLPMLGRFARPMARMATSALSSGAINKLQGGTFGGGAAVGGGAAGLGEAARSVAPSIAESALGITKRLRGFGKTPGTAALEETRGVNPSKIESTAQERLGKLTGELESLAAGSATPASTAPAISIVDGEMTKAMKQNNKVRYSMLQDIKDQLTKEFSTGQTIPSQIPATKALDLKRGIGDLETTWNPESRSGMKPVIRKVYGALDKELDQAVPGSEKLNQRISSLIPVAQRAESAGRGAEFGQRIAGRLAAHTGALAGTGMGSYYGFQRGGPEGAVVGGLAGLAVPELLASPTGQMMAARSLNSPIPARAATGITSQLLSRSNKSKKPEKK